MLFKVTNQVLILMMIVQHGAGLLKLHSRITTVNFISAGCQMENFIMLVYLIHCIIMQEHRWYYHFQMMVNFSTRTISLRMKNTN